MRIFKRTIFALTLLLAALCAPGSAQQSGAPAAPSEPSDPFAGDGFRLKGLDGKFYDTAEMRGDVLVFSFGATWCVPCTWELVAIEELKQEYAGKPVRFLWVSIENPKAVSNNLLRHYVKERRLTLPVLRDPGGVALAMYEKTGQRIPVMVFFDTEGNLSAPVHQGMSQDIARYKQMVRGRVDALLARRGAPAGASPAAK
ncbi:MAG TPA: TlpA disulfide reductase family protein [Pyrinomonadaceae bacterium]|jgi:thiol-disulfide isomerase/thioredoxin